MRVRALVGAASVAVALATVASPGSAQSFSVGTGGSDVPVRLDDRLSSQDAVAGQHFKIETTAPVTIAGRLVPAGTPGEGVVDVAHPGVGRTPGSLAISVLTLDPPGAPPIAIALPDAESGERAPGQLGASGGGIVLGGGRRDGSNVVYERGMKFGVVVPVPDSDASPSPAPIAPATASAGPRR